MKDIFKRLLLILNTPRSLPAVWMLRVSKSHSVVVADIDRWVNIKGGPVSKSVYSQLNWLLFKFPEFRNLFYQRIKKHNPIISYLLRFFYKPLSSLYIYTTDIGEGFYIQHGFSTIITAKRIGKNCSINQQVTVGYGNSEHPPVIGDNVLIASGAKVFGDITVGNDVKIGANSVVLRNVPDNCTVVGVPGKVVKHNGARVNIDL